MKEQTISAGDIGAAMDRSIPLTDFTRTNAILAYAQNGEPLRPSNGYPLRLVVPELEGIKWLGMKRIGRSCPKSTPTGKNCRG